jgi:hypothetical protein
VLLVCVLALQPNNSVLYVCLYFLFIYTPLLSLSENITIPYHRKKGSYKRTGKYYDMVRESKIKSGVDVWALNEA